MADVLASATLLVTALTLIYSTWAASIDGAVATKLGTTAQERARQAEQASAILKRRAVPVATACWLTLILFLPRDLSIVDETLRCRCTGGCAYDDISSVFLLTQLVVGGLACHVTSRSMKVAAVANRARVKSNSLD